MAQIIHNTTSTKNFQSKPKTHTQTTLREHIWHKTTHFKRWHTHDVPYQIYKLLQKTNTYAKTNTKNSITMILPSKVQWKLPRTMPKPLPTTHTKTSICYSKTYHRTSKRWHPHASTTSNKPARTNTHNKQPNKIPHTLNNRPLYSPNQRQT